MAILTGIVLGILALFFVVISLFFVVKENDAVQFLICACLAVFHSYGAYYSFMMVQP